MTIREKIILELKDALKGLSQLGDMLRDIAGRLGLLKAVTRQGQQSLVLDTQRIAASFDLMGSIATGALNEMISNSPSLAAEISSLTYEFDLLFMELGENLAPVIDPFIDALKDMVNEFRDLPAPVQQFIGLTIALTAAISALAVVVAILTTVSLPLIAVILAIAMAISTIIVIWQNWNSIMKWWQQQSLLVKGMILMLMAVFAPFLLAIVGIIAVIKNWGNIVSWLQGAWSGMISFFSGLWDALKSGFKGVVDFIWNAWEGLLGFFGGVGGAIHDLISAGFEVFKGIVNSIGSWINANVISPINEALAKMRDIEILGGKPFEFLPTIPEIPQFAQGAFNIPQNMLAVVHRGEMIIPRPFAEDLRRRGGFGGGNVYVTVQIESPVIRSEQDIDELVRVIEERVSRSILEKLELTTNWR